MSHAVTTGVTRLTREQLLREHVLRLGVWMFLATVAMLFAAFSSAYLIRGSSPDWQPIGIPWVLWVNTAVLIVSTGTLEVARRQARSSRLADAGFWMLMTWILGTAFLIGQLAAWRQLVAAGIQLPTTPHASFFFVLTGAHGVHAVAALTVLTLASVGILRRGRSDRDTRTRRLVDLGGLFWHFLTGLWIYLLILLTVFQG